MMLTLISYFNVHVIVQHCNVARSTTTRSSFDNDERHVTAFRSISEAARSWSYDNTITPCCVCGVFVLMCRVAQGNVKDI